jgi:hypothetical protein
MDDQNAQSALKQNTYGKDSSFDVRVGMQVHGPTGQLLGTVSEVAGFGATHHLDASQPVNRQNITQSEGGTGFIKVDRREISGRRDASPLVVPFHGVQTVTAELGVVLKDTVLAQLADQEGQAAARASEKAPATPTGWWRKTVRRVTGRGEDSTAVELEIEELREEAARREHHGDAQTASDIVARRGISGNRDPEFTLGGGDEQSAFDEDIKS